MSQLRSPRPGTEASGGRAQEAKSASAHELWPSASTSRAIDRAECLPPSPGPSEPLASSSLLIFLLYSSTPSYLNRVRQFLSPSVLLVSSF